MGRSKSPVLAIHEPKRRRVLLEPRGSRRGGTEQEKFMVRASILVLLATSLGACGEEVGLGSGKGPAGNTDGGSADASTCNPTLVCAQGTTCVDGFLYPTGCGPTNCDAPTGTCPPVVEAGADALATLESGTDAPADGPSCNPALACVQVLTCVGSILYPTPCGPTNCDKAIGPCPAGDAEADAAASADANADADIPVESGTNAPADGPSCDPTLLCLQTLTCIGHLLYPSTCGPTNCDKPLGPC
jgi:hypothetical protein